MRKMKKNLLKTAATGAAMAAMMMSSVMVFAEDGEVPTTTPIEGTSTNEGHLDTTVYSVVLPTVPEGIFNMKLDPEGLITATSHARYENATFTGDGLYFATATANTYAGTSQSLKITNKSTNDLTVTITVSVTDATGLNFVGEDGDTKKDAAVYLALVTGTDKTAVAESSGDLKATKAVTISGTAANFEKQWDSTAEKYVYAVKSDKTDADFQNVEFALTGKCFNKGWNATTGAVTPKVSVTYAITPVDGYDVTTAAATTSVTPATPSAPVATPASLSASVKTTVISGLEEDDELTTVEYIKADGTKANIAEGTHYSYSDGTFTVLKDGLLAESLVGAKWVLTFGSKTVEIPIVSAN